MERQSFDPKPISIRPFTMTWKHIPVAKNALPLQYKLYYKGHWVHQLQCHFTSASPGGGGHGCHPPPPLLRWGEKLTILTMELTLALQALQYYAMQQFKIQCDESIYVLIKLWSSCLIACLRPCVRILDTEWLL